MLITQRRERSIFLLEGQSIHIGESGKDESGSFM